MEIPGFIISLLKEGITIELDYKGDTVGYFLNTGMKSEAYLTVGMDKRVTISMRYGEKAVLDTCETDEEMVRDIAYVVNKRCRLGRPFSNDSWEKLFKKLGLTPD